jgi:hypothetical protein
MKTLLALPLSFAVLALASFAHAQETPPAPPAPGTTQTPSQGGVIIEQVPTEQSAEPPPPAPDQPAQPQPVKKPKSVPVGIRVDGGYSFRTIEKLPANGADFGLGIGAQPARHFAVYGAARGFIGSTDAGLGVKALRLTCDFDIVIDRFRIGFDPGIFIVGIDRATKDQSIVGWGPKLGVAARFDVVRADVFALFLRAAADGGPTFSDGSLFGGVTLGGGIDFDIKPGDRESL